MIPLTLEKSAALRKTIMSVGKLTGWYGGVAVYQVEWHNVQAVHFAADEKGVFAYSSSSYLKAIDKGELARKLAEIKGAHNV